MDAPLATPQSGPVVEIMRRVRERLFPGTPHAHLQIFTERDYTGLPFNDAEVVRVTYQISPDYERRNILFRLRHREIEQYALEGR